MDVIATQRHFLNLGTPLAGCRLTAADVSGDSSVNTVDVIAIQRFFLGLSTGIANTGTYKFTPVNCFYVGIVTNQTGQNTRYWSLATLLLLLWNFGRPGIGRAIL